MESFLRWLESHGFKHTRGDMHYAGSGWWYPVLPDLTTGAEDPHPPEPWIHVDQDRASKAVFIGASFAEGAYTEDPAVATEVITHLVMAYDEALGAEPFAPPEWRTAAPVAIIRGGDEARYAKQRQQTDEAWERREREWQERNAPMKEKVRLLKEKDSFGDFGASSSGPAGRFVMDWVWGRLGPKKTKEAALSRSLDGSVDTLYSYMVPIASMIARKYLVVSTREALSRTSVTTNRHLSWVTHAAQGVGFDPDQVLHWSKEGAFPPGQFAFLTEGRIPVNVEEWQSALVAFDARNSGVDFEGQYPAGSSFRLRGVR